MNAIRVLSAGDVGRALAMDRLIPAMKDAFTALSSGEAQVPGRLNLKLRKDAEALIMPAHLPRSGRLAVKVVNVMGENPARDLPLIHGVVLVFDSETGKALALMDGELLTAARTGAGSGLACRYLAREDARVLALFGAGVQAATQLEAVCAVRSIEQVLVVGRDPDRTARFCRKMSEQHTLPVIPATTEAALAAADIICTATTATTPLFEAALVRPGTHINAVGGYRPHTTELAPTLVGNARVVVDSKSACLAEAGEILQAINAGLLRATDIDELGEVVSRAVPARKNESEVTLFKSVGNAVQDLVAAGLVLEQAEALGLGLLAEL